MRKELHWGWYWLAILFGLCMVTAVGTQAQTPPPVNHVAYSPAVRHALDSLADDARTNRVENALCISAYSVTDSVLTLEKVSPAVYLKADSITITANGQICPGGVPSIHSHVATNALQRPSDTDLFTEKVRGVWGIVLNVHDSGWYPVVY